MRVMSVVGNRPQFVKAAPLSRALRAVGTEVLVHSGQHYDPDLADLFFDELGIPQPDHALGVGRGSPLRQVAAIITALEDLISADRPDVVLVYGDTTTTLAGALAAAKTGVPLAHVEAGLRSFDRTMPEEQNRVVTDHLSDLLLCPTAVAVRNLEREGVTEGVHMVGDVMFDAALMFREAALRAGAPTAAGLPERGYALITVHRAAATDTREALEALLEVLRAVPGPAVFPVHPRTRARLEEAGLWEAANAVPGVALVPPVGYLPFTGLLANARVVVTDSGGVQKEAFFHGVPCVTLRDTTEWVETVEHGFNVLTGMDAARVREALRDPRVPEGRPDLYGDGDAAGRIAALVADLAGAPRWG
jgi:UDP-N-acetylglucosamine 2-epimerase